MLFATLSYSLASAPMDSAPPLTPVPRAIPSFTHSVSPSETWALDPDLQELFMGRFVALRQSVHPCGLFNCAHPLSVCVNSAGLDEIAPESEMPTTQRAGRK